MVKSGCLSERVKLSILMASGVIVIYMARINLSVAIVDMVKVVNVDAKPNEKFIPFCQRNISEVATQNITIQTNVNYNQSVEIDLEELEDKILLTNVQKGLVLGAFFYGYVTTNIIGGRMAEIYGTKLIFGVGVFLGSICTLITPWAARIDYRFLIAVRILLGAAHGASYPSMHALQAKWIPPAERTKFTASVYLANCIGIVLTMPISGVVIEAFGWDWVFYIIGIISLIWTIIWGLFMFDTPQKHPNISIEELEYIKDALATNDIENKPKSVPWKSILLCVPMWAISLVTIGNMIVLNLLLTQLPTFMHTILGFSIKHNALLSSLPFLSRYIGANFWGFVCDILISKNILSYINSRRVFACLGIVGPGTLFVIVGYSGCSPYAVVTFFTIGTFFNGACLSGFTGNHLDLAPNFAGTMFGLSNTFAFAFSTAVPVVVGAMINDNTTTEWQSVFWLTFSIVLSAFIFYSIFCSVDLQPWNSNKEKIKENNINKEIEAKDSEEKEELVPQEIKTAVV